jgi:hypothetical protein
VNLFSTVLLDGLDDFGLGVMAGGGDEGFVLAVRRCPAVLSPGSANYGSYDGPRRSDAGHDDEL